MNETLTKIKNSVKDVIPFRKVNPHKYWNNLLYVFFGIIILLVIFSFYLLYKINNQQMIQIAPSNNKTPNLINEGVLNKIDEVFNSKEIKVNEVKNGLIKYKDPSVN